MEFLEMLENSKRQMEDLRARMQGQRLEQQHIEVLLTLTEAILTTVAGQVEGLETVRREVFTLKDAVRGVSTSMDKVSIKLSPIESILAPALDRITAALAAMSNRLAQRI